MPILVKTHDIRSGRKAKAHDGGYGWHRSQWLNDTKVIPSFTIWIIHKKYTQFQHSNRSSHITLSNMKNDCGTVTVPNATVHANQSTVASSSDITPYFVWRNYTSCLQRVRYSICEDEIFKIVCHNQSTKLVERIFLSVYKFPVLCCTVYIMDYGPSVRPSEQDIGKVFLRVHWPWFSPGS